MNNISLPDYRQLALEAKTAATFDYAAFMVLRDDLYTEQSRVTTIRDLISEDWEPGPQINAAMLEALEVYRDKRQGAQRRGSAAREAHHFALVEAQIRYGRLTKQ
jgi:hypothetical protein